MDLRVSGGLDAHANVDVGAGLTDVVIRPRPVGQVIGGSVLIPFGALVILGAFTSFVVAS